MGLLTRPSHFMLGGHFGVNVKDFGPPGMVGNGDPVYDGPAFQKALAYMQSDNEQRGGKLVVPRGLYRPTAPIAPTSYQLLTNVYIEGEGESTRIDGVAMPANSDIIGFGHGVQFGASGLFLTNAKRNCLRIRAGALGSGLFSQQCTFSNIRMQGAVGDNLYCENTYGITMRDMWSRDPGGCAFNFMGFHTHADLARLWANSALNNPGFQINGMVYSTLTALAADSNKWGYSLTNVAGLVMVGCGAEASGAEHILLRANGTLAANNFPENQDISGLTIMGGLWLHGNKSGADGAAASFIGATAEGGRDMDITLIGTKSYKNPDHLNDKTISAAATAAGSVIKFRSNELGNIWDATNATSGPGTVTFV